MAEQWQKYYLVAIPEGELADRGAALQREFSRRYGIYRDPYPPLHLTVAIILSPLERLKSLEHELAGVVCPRLPLKLRTLGESCFPDPYRSINLAVEGSAALRELSVRIIETVTAAGCAAEPFDSWDYHISLVNSNYAAREWTEAEYREACELLSRKELDLTGRARRLELWDPEFPPLKVLSQFKGN